MSFRGAPRLNFGRDELIEMGRRNRAERTQEEAVRRRAQRAQSQEGKERRAIETGRQRQLNKSQILQLVQDHPEGGKTAMRNLRERMNRAEKLGEPLPIPDFLKERVRQRATLQQARNLRGAGIDVGSGVVEDVRARVRGARLGTSSSSEEEGFGKGGSGRSRRTPTGFSMPRGDFEVPRTTRGVGVEEKDEPLQRRRIRAPEPEPEPEPERASTPEEDIHRSLTAPGGFSRRAFGSESEEEEDPELAAQLRRQTRRAGRAMLREDKAAQRGLTERLITGGSSGGSSLTPIRGGSGRAGGTQEAGALREALGTVTRSPLTPLERAQEAVDRIHGWTPGGQAVPKGEGVTLQLAPP